MSDDELSRTHLFTVEVTDYRLMTRDQARLHLDSVLYEASAEVVLMLIEEEEDE